MNYLRLNSAKGFLKDIKTGNIFPVFEKGTIENIEIDNLSLKQKHLDHQIRFEVVTKGEYDKYMGIEPVKIIKKPINMIEKPIKNKPGRKPVKK